MSTTALIKSPPIFVCGLSIQMSPSRTPTDLAKDYLNNKIKQIGSNGYLSYSSIVKELKGQEELKSAVLDFLAAKLGVDRNDLKDDASFNNAVGGYQQRYTWKYGNTKPLLGSDNYGPLKAVDLKLGRKTISAVLEEPETPGKKEIPSAFNNFNATDPVTVNVIFELEVTKSIEKVEINTSPSAAKTISFKEIAGSLLPRYQKYYGASANTITEAELETALKLMYNLQYEHSADGLTSGEKLFLPPLEFIQGVKDYKGTFWNTPTQLRRLTSPPPPGGDTTLPPEARAFLDTIAAAEGTYHAYDIMFTEKVFHGYDAHPNQVNSVWYGGKELRSTAAGRYQFLKSTWDETVAQYEKKYDVRINNFSPENQDKIAWYLACRRAGGEDKLLSMLKTNPEKAFHLVSAIWASLPNTDGESVYGQPVKSIVSLLGFYRQRTEAYTAKA